MKKGLTLALIFLLVSNIYFAKRYFELRQFLMPEKTIIEAAKANPESWATVNKHWRFTDDKKSKNYYTYKIDYPLKYTVSSEEMIVSYISTGGGQPPDLIFTTKAISSYEDFEKLIKNDEPCITVTSGSQGFGNVDNEGLLKDGYWVPLKQVDNQPNKLKKEKFVDGLRVIKRTVINSLTNQRAMDASIRVADGLYYYFESCNEESAADLERMLETFDTRENYYRHYNEKGPYKYDLWGESE